MVGVDLDGTGPGLATVGRVQASRRAAELQRIAERLVGGAQRDGDVLPGCKIRELAKLRSQIRKKLLTVAVNTAAGVLVALVAGVEVGREEADIAVILLTDDLAVNVNLLVGGLLGGGRDCICLLVGDPLQQELLLLTLKVDLLSICHTDVRLRSLLVYRALSEKCNRYDVI